MLETPCLYSVVIPCFMIMMLFLTFLNFQEERYSDGVKRLEFDKHLGPYTLSQYGDWKHLSNYITRDTVDHLGR